MGRDARAPKQWGDWYDHSIALEVMPIRVGDQTDGWVAWGPQTLDIDNDADLDIFIAFGFLDTHFGNGNEPGQKDSLWIHHADGSFTNEAQAWALADAGPTRGAAFADANRDGWLDAIFTAPDGPIRLRMSRCCEASWLRLRFQSHGANIFGVGTRIRATRGDKVWHDAVRAGGTGYANAGPPEILLGLGTHEQLDRLEIIWPDGAVDEITDVNANQEIVTTQMVAAANRPK